MEEFPPFLIAVLVKLPIALMIWFGIRVLEPKIRDAKAQRERSEAEQLPATPKSSERAQELRTWIDERNDAINAPPLPRRSRR